MFGLSLGLFAAFSGSTPSFPLSEERSKQEDAFWPRWN